MKLLQHHSHSSLKEYTQNLEIYFAWHSENGI